ncbi:MAG: 6-hydroxycyclohex-1-ene-1-carbonyl-CoA dehydrogenase [Sterolibacterium sp.]|nr:6-hydroxycyclohex-1-ene-1-carbonyl-CoA dehydrogenase [Sterolibacterium sp.]
MRTIAAWQMVAAGELRRVSLPLPVLAAGEVLVEVHGCGVCHTDLSYFYDGVPTLQKPPLTLGHEISGIVVAAAESDSPLLGRAVIVPAVLPCHVCEICRMGRPNRCLQQKMPGNSLGIYGGFASHIPVPGRDLCRVPEVPGGGLTLAHLAVVADAVTTPYQAAQRAAVTTGDRVVVIGAGGGVGGYMTQMAKALGAAVVVGIDLHAGRLAALQDYGLDHAIPAAGMSPPQIRAAFKEISASHHRSRQMGWKIFECSGSQAGQALAMELLSFVGKLVVVGYGRHTLPFNLSRLMAFDAEIIGSWGCAPAAYPTVLQMCLDGRIALMPFVDLQPMRHIHEVFADAHAGKLMRRVVLTPDF